MAQFNRFHLSSYRTSDPEVAKTLLPAAIKQTGFWVNKFGFSDEQKAQTQILSGNVPRTKSEKGQFIVLALIPLEDNQAFPAVWDAPLSETLGEDITFELKQRGVK